MAVSTKMKMVLVFLLIVSDIWTEKSNNFNLNFFQSDYHLVPEWFEVVSYNKEYVNELSITVFKPNRSCGAVNMSMSYKLDLGSSLEFVTQTYKFASNEYREFPARMQYNFCKAVAADVIGLGRIHDCGNITECSFAKNKKYRLCNWTVDERKLPPFFPTGRYMVEIQGVYQSKELFILRSYAAVVRPVSLLKQ